MTLDEVRALKRELRGLTPNRAIALRVAARWAFRYVPKEKKKSKVDRLAKFIRQETGLSKTMAEAIADTLVRSGRDINALALQREWPIEDGTIEGPKGNVSVTKVRDQL